ncbi:hypothetical protein AAFX24_17295 [Vibrio mediterranei]|uniref:hypothetical protein n=1 Tax=Vibrio mediterranei TaxID=689 RepID=UPI0038CEBE49
MLNKQLTIEEHVIHALKKTALPKSEIARQCNVTRGSVQHWSRTGKISKQNLLKLCQVLSIDINTFFDVEKEMGSLKPLQEKVIYLVRTLPNSDYHKLEDVIQLLTTE